jgi:hypothetical protein
MNQPAERRKTWVIVARAGCMDQYVVVSFSKFDYAVSWLTSHPRAAESEEWDIMKRLPDSTLTTEY